MAKLWEDIEITTDSGEKAAASAPVIISASRSTDIPAFYTEWLIDRLRKGYSAWINPFNGKKYYVSFSKTRLFVFWSKNPAPLLQYLEEFDRRGIGYYFQFTLNDYEQEGFEPYVPPLEQRLETFTGLSRKVGRGKVIWRFDPLILSPSTDSAELASRIERIGSRLVPYTNKLVISFVDIVRYPKVRNNLIRDSRFNDEYNVNDAEFSEEMKIRFAEYLKELLVRFKTVNPAFEIATCAEQVDLQQCGITHNKCIDDRLIADQFRSDRELTDFLGIGKDYDKGEGKRKSLKDKGQRKDCGCIASKDIGSYNTCPHLCAYCYANSSKASALRAFERHDPSAGTI